MSIPNLLLLLLLSTIAVVLNLLSSVPISSSVRPFWNGDDPLLSVSLLFNCVGLSLLFKISFWKQTLS